MRSDSTGVLIERPRLLEALDGVLESRLGLLTAPAGYGKSVLVRQWLDLHHDVASETVALDRRDNDPSRFWQSVVRQLASSVPTVGEDVARLARFVNAGTVLQLVEALSEALAQSPRRTVLVLDDFHLIDDPTVIDSVDLLLDEIPASFHLLVAGRHDPRLPISRLRLQGQVVELREADLRFTLAETGALLERSDVVLDEPTLDLLQARVEGWSGALRLAMLSMENAEDPADVVRNLTGSHGVISDYLLEEVLEAMTPARREFLLATSIVDEVTGDLADELTGRRDGASVLASLAQEGVFTSPSDRHGGWYRIHQLLRDLLRARLRHGDAERFKDLHRRAADYLRADGTGADSIRHALAADEPELAAEWLGTIAPEMLASGRVKTAADLSEEVLRASEPPSALALLTRWWTLYAQAAPPAELDTLGDALEVALQAAPEADDVPLEHGDRPAELVSRSSIPWLRGMRARARGDLDTLVALDDPAVIPSPSGRVEVFVAEGLLWIEEDARAGELLAGYLELAERSHYPPSTVHGLGLLALASLMRGDVGFARESSSRALGIASEYGLEQTIQPFYAGIVDAWLAWAGSDLERAEARALALQRVWEQSSDIPVAVQVAILRSRIRRSLGDRNGARSLLDQASVGAGGRTVEGHFAQRIRLARASLDLLDGDVTGATRWLPEWRRQLREATTSNREQLVLLRMAIAAREDLDVVHDLLRRVDSANATSFIEAGTLRSLAFLAEDQMDDATAALAPAIRTAGGVGFFQPILDERALLAPIIRNASREAGTDMPGLTSDAPAADSAYVKPLSERERMILELMATHLSYPEIADELHISPTTVKSHVQSIFRKLAVGRRSEAVEQGMAFGLIR